MLPKTRKEKMLHTKNKLQYDLKYNGAMMPNTFDFVGLFNQDDSIKDLVNHLETEGFKRKKERSGMDNYNQYAEINGKEYPDKVSYGGDEE